MAVTGWDVVWRHLDPTITLGLVAEHDFHCVGFVVLNVAMDKMEANFVLCEDSGLV